MMTQMNIKIETDLKQNVDNIFRQLGITTTDAIRIFLKKVQFEKGIPFEMKLNYENTWDDLNIETKQAIKEADNNIDKLERYNTTEELFKSMGITNY